VENRPLGRKCDNDPIDSTFEWVNPIGHFVCLKVRVSGVVSVMHLAFFALLFLFFILPSRLQGTQAWGQDKYFVMVHQTQDTKYIYWITKGLLVVILPIPNIIVVITHGPILAVVLIPFLRDL